MWFILLVAVALAGVGAYFYFNQPEVTHSMGIFWELAGVGVMMMFLLIGISFLIKRGGARRGSLRLLLILLLLFLLPAVISYAGSVYNVRITWYAYPDIHEYDSPLCRYNGTHIVYIHGSLGLMGTTNPRFGIFISQHGKPMKPIVDLTSHTRRLSEGPIGWRTEFTIVAKSTGYYVDGIRICPPGEINLALKPDSHIQYNIEIVPEEGSLDPVKVVRDHPLAVGLGTLSLLGLFLLRR